MTTSTNPTKSWTRLLGTNSDDRAHALTTGADGAIYLAGGTYGNLDGQTNGGSNDAFITKYNSDGTKAWTRLLGSSANNYANALATGIDGTIYMAGLTQGSIDGQTYNGGYCDAFITKYNPDGTKVWTRLVGSFADDDIYGLATGIDGAVYAVGNNKGGLDGQPNSGSYDALLVKYNPDGTKAWARLLGSSSSDFAYALTTGADDAIYVAGETQGSLDGQPSSGGFDAFLSKYTPNGTKVWTRLLGTSSDDPAWALTTGFDGSIYMAGRSSGNLDGQTNSGSDDAFLTKYNPDGTKVWTRLLGTSAYQEGRALTTGTDGAIYIAGSTVGNLDGQTTNGSVDAFLTKYQVQQIPSLQFSTISGSANEGNRGNSGSTTVTVQATLSAASTQTVTVPITYSGTATPGTDYTNPTSSITVPAGRISANASFTVLGESMVEPNETIVLTMGTPTNATLGTNATFTHTVINDDFPLTPVRNSGNGRWYQVVQTDVDWSAALKAAAISTYRGLGGYLLVIDDQQENSFIIQTLSGASEWLNYWLGLSDAEREGSWAIMSGPNIGSPATFFNWSPGEPNNIGDGENFAEIDLYGTWNDNDADSIAQFEGYIIEYGGLPAAYTITPSATSVNEGSSVTFTIDTKNVEWGSTLSYTLAGISQADLASGTLTGTAIVNEQGVDGRAVVTVNLANDQIAENESVTLTVGATTSSPVRIIDTTRPLPTIQFASTTRSSNEGNSGTTAIAIDAVLSAATTQPVTVPITYAGTATQGADYSNAATTLTIAAGQTTGSATFSVVGDTTVESNETVILTMGTPTNAALGTNATFTHTILNDDTAPVQSIKLGTVNGVPLNLIFPYTTSKGKTYYLLDLNNDGKSSSADFIGHDKTDILFNGGNDTFDTQPTGAVAGVDDARTIVVSGYTIVQPTYDEIVALRSERAYVFPTGWQPEDYDSPNIPSATRVSSNVHYNVSYKSTNLYTNLYDGYGYNGTLFLQVLRESGPDPTVQFASTTRSSNEGNSGTTAIAIDAVLSATTTQPVTVPITYAGTATQGADYSNATNTITIAAGQTTGSASFSVVGDITFEGNETVILTMGTPTNATLGTNATFTHTILNDDVVIPTVQFTAATTSFNEGNSGSTTVTVAATLSAASTQAVTAPITYSGTATQGTDYSNATNTITIAAGQTTGSATFSVVGDTTVESSETVILTMGTPSNATLGTNATFTHTIINDDIPLTPVRSSGNGRWYQIMQTDVDWSAALKAAAGSTYRGLGGYLLVIDDSTENSFVKTLPGLAGSNFIYWLGITDVEREGTWMIQSGPDAGKPARFFDWAPGEPNNAGGDEDYVHINIPWANGSTQWNDITLQAPTPRGYVVEYGGLPASYTITPSANVVNEGSSVTFTIDTKNVEWGSALSYTLIGIGQADLASGALTGTTVVNQQGVDGRAIVTVNLANDQLAENESVTLTVGTTTSSPVRIIDAPALPTVQFASTTSSANEGNSGSATVTVAATLSAASTQAVTVPITYSGTATQGTDYSNATNTITIAAGQTTGSVTFSVVGDTTVEPNETVILTMGTPTNATLGTNSIYTHTILNDDVAIPSTGPFVVWTRLLGTSSYDSASALTTGADGAIYMAGYTQGSLDGPTYSGSDDAFLTRYNPDGTKAWTRLLGTSASDSASALTTGTDGAIYMAGYTTGNLDGQSYSGSNDAFLTKYNPDGTKAWTRLLGTSASEESRALTTGKDGAIYMAGRTGGNLDGQSNSGGPDAFLTKYNADGTKAWTRLLGTSSGEYAYALTTGTDGAIYMAGGTSGNLDGQTNSGGGDAFLTKYNPDGTKAWTQLLGTSSYDGAFALTTGTDGAIYMAGQTGGNFDGQTNSGNFDTFLTKYNADGTKSWTRLLGPSPESVPVLTTGSDGAIYMAGFAYGNLDGQTNSGRGDAFLTKYDANGTKVWTRLLGTSSGDSASALTTGKDGAIYMAGYTGGNLDGQTNSGNWDAFLAKYQIQGPSLQFSTASGSANEGNSGSTTVTVQATLSAASTQAVTVPITYSGTATQGTDYSNAATTITIAAGQTTGSATFSVVGDTVGESNETVILTMGTPTNAILGTNTTFTHTIVNDDSAPPPAQRTGAFLPAGTHIAFASPLVNAYGAGGQETVMLGAGAAQVRLDQNVDRVHLSDAPSAYLFQQTGNQLNVFAAKGGELILTVALQTDADGTVLVFPDGSASATVGAGGMRLGGTIVPSTVPTAIVFTFGATVAPPTGPSTAGVFLGRDASFTAASSGLKVYGAAGNEVLAIARGTSGIEANQLVERFQLDCLSTSAAFWEQRGNQLLVHEGTMLRARMPVQTDADGTLITTTDGTMQAKVSAAGMFLGGTRVSSTGPGPVVPTIVDMTMKAPRCRLEVSVSSAGSFDASNEDVTFRMEELTGSYVYLISGFGVGDRIVGPVVPGSPSTLVPSLEDQTDPNDGKLSLEYADTGKVAKITLTGLSPDQDKLIFGPSDLNIVFGPGTLA